jgi:N-acetylmuramoyl-L-alanine amidase
MRARYFPHTMNCYWLMFVSVIAGAWACAPMAHAKADAYAGTEAATEAVSGMRIWAKPERTRAVLDISAPVDYTLFALKNPARLVIDVKIAAAHGLNSTEPKGMISGVRVGTPNQGQVRIVFDLTQNVRPKTFFLRPRSGGKHRLVLDLYADGAPEAAPVVRAPSDSSARNVVVVIDAGHGGKDPGSIGPGGTHESLVTLKIAQALAKRINEEAGMEAKLTRNDDTFIELEQRFAIARDQKADVFISIHADSFSSSSVRGSSVYVLSQRGATSEGARYLADLENRTDLVGGVSLEDKDRDVAQTLLQLSQDAVMVESASMAEQVLASLKAFGKAHRRYVDQANFVVLRSPDVPSMLIETGFISNPSEEKNLKSTAYVGKLADAILDGLRNYFVTAPPPGTWLAKHSRQPTRVQAKMQALAVTAGKSHLVVSGETLSGIAQQHQVSVRDIRRVNRLRSDVVKVGSTLRIPDEG